MASKRSSNFIARWLIFIKERFPPQTHVILILIVFTANGLVALESLGLNILIGRNEILGFIATLLVFLHLRIFDEIKDHETDVKVHPERPLARGLISLKEGRLVASFLVVIELIIVLFISRPALVAIAAVIFYSLLMYWEFFIKEWLRPRLVTYALTHSIISGLIPLFIFSCITGLYPWQLPGTFGLYAIVNVLLSNIFEFSRKMFAQDEEKNGIDSYSRTLGPGKAAAAVLFMVLVTLIMGAVLANLFNLNPMFFLLLGLLFLIMSIVSLLYAITRQIRWAKLYRAAGSLYILVFNLSIMAGLLWMQ